MQLRLSWTDPISGRSRRPLLNVPVALGQAFEAMPVEISGQSVSRMVIGDRQVRDFQALLVEVEGGLYLVDNGGQTYINQQQVNGQARLGHGDRIRIGETELELQIMGAPPSSPSQHSTHFQTLPEPTIDPGPATNGNGNGNGHHRTIVNDPDQANLSNPGIPNSDHNSGSHLNGQSSNGNGNGRSKSIVPEPLPSALDNQPSLPANHNGQQLPPVPQSNGHLPQANGTKLGNGHNLSNGHNGQSSGFPSPAPIHQPPQPPTPAPPAIAPSPVAVPQPLQLPNSSRSSGCRRMVGFLFKRSCGRDNSSGCDHCANGYSNHAYSADYDLYEGFGRFEPGDWGYGLLENHEQR